VPFTLKAEDLQGADLARIEGHQFTYRRKLIGRETVAAEFSGFGSAATDYNITIENSKAGAGMKIIGNRPLSREHVWSIRSVVSLEPFIDMSIEPGKAFTWKYDYTYYSVNQAKR
jgi:hypothetical protein